MSKIFKKYRKLFIKTWVETIGTILFLVIFTMIVFGILATPLQLTLKASYLLKNTNS
ncbi:hypothetical protein [Spiroplasma tabanidicola]|uniref:Uncharacterized protein n=1 Tax=Spiroplasma tabanidicola TaxID=324079 RepID=A0A6I6CHF8_9MOLU|nr:hypothetical protein [Spiroplasma tabanidicola]QGS51473.1 hypothetical protein STABA_v1c01060 [Spiroplasma tabanidicola]